MDKLFSRLLRKLKAMSLVEIMVGLIVLSAISAAFSPVIINRMKNDVKVSVINETTRNCALGISKECLQCDKTKKVCLDCMKDCPDGYRVDTKTCTCKPCSENCKHCNETGKGTHAFEGYYVNSGVCLPCPEGQKCSGDENPPEACPPGTYGKGAVARTECTDCAKGHMCPDPNPSDNVGATDQTPCTPGKYQSDTGEATCEPCPVDNMCPNTKMTQPTPCTPPLTTNGKTGQTKCEEKKPPAGCCGLGQYWDTTKLECTDCKAGEYQNEKTDSKGACQTACKKCSAGKCGGCDEVGKETDGSACLAGTYCTIGQTACSKCTAGHCRNCNTTGKTSNGAECLAGTYCTAGQTACSPCTAGHCKNCNTTGKTSNGAVCDAGTYCTAGQTACSKCTAGYCNGCNKTGRTSNGGACAAGKYCTAGQTACSPCTAGHCKNCNTTGKTSNGAACDKGTYCTGGQTACKPCSAGKCQGCNITGKTTDGDCCAAGKYCAAGQQSCTTCEKGYKCAGCQNRKACGAGTYQNATGQTVCKNCNSGKYQNSNAQSACKSCTYKCTSSAGTCPAGATTSQNCSWTSGAVTKCNPCGCDTCPAGKYHNAACQKTASCTNCSAGKYQNLTGQTACKKCTAGHCKGCTSTGRTSNGAACDAGTYCTEGQSVCSKCTAGHCQGCTSTGRTSNGGACAAGKYCTAGQTACSNCTAGHCKGCTSTGKTSNGAACDAGTYCTAGKTSCVKCTAGHAVGCNKTGKTTNGTCCPSGKWSNAGDTACSNCPVGYKCVKTNDTTCAKTACPAGQYSAGGASVCTKCPAGYRCPGSSNKVACAAGTYSAAGASVCSTCPKGYYCPGSKDKQACPAGQYQNATGKTSCLKCSVGHCSGCNKTARTSNGSGCAAGSYCTAGQTACHKCEKGYKCPGSANRAACNGGQIAATTGCSACAKCDCGKYAPASGAQSTCTACPAGKYSAKGASACSAPAEGYGISSTKCQAFKCPYSYGCKTCTCGSTSASCKCTGLKTGYFWHAKDNGETVPGRCRAGTVYVKAMRQCVMNHNIGDDLTNFAWNKAATGVDHGNGISVSNKSKYCWEKKASGSRTVCTWYATNAICAYFGGRIVYGGWHEEYIMSNSSVAKALGYCTNSSCPPTQNCPTYQNNYESGNATISDSSSKKNYCYPGFYHTENTYEQNGERSRHRRFDKIAKNQPGGGSDARVPKSGRCAFNVYTW